MDFRSWLYVSCLCVAGFAACAAFPAGAAAPAPYVPVTDCEAARKLPAEVDAAARRIACEIPADYREDVSRAEALGTILRRHDIAAWLTSDSLNAAGALSSLPGEPAGWLSEENGDRVDVRYFARADGRTVAFAQSSLPLRTPLAARDSRRLDPPQPASERELRLLAAIKLARAQSMTYCANAPPNTVAIEWSEPEQPAQILVFLMSPWTDDSLPLGGHALLRVSRDGSRVLERFEQTRSCVNLDPRELEKVEALTIGHLTSDTPTCFHAFMSLQYRKPIYVTTVRNRLLWKIEDGRIRLLPAGATEADDPADEAKDAKKRGAKPVQARAGKR